MEEIKLSFIISKTKNRSYYRILDELRKNALNTGEVKKYSMDKKELEEYLKKYTYRKPTKVIEVNKSAHK